MKEDPRWFERGLGARIDALEMALTSLKRKETLDTTVLRNLAHSLVAPAQTYGYLSVSRAARAIETTTDDALPDGVRTLIDILRQEASKTNQAITTILLVGGNTAFNDRLTKEIAAPSRNIVCTDTAAGAQEAIRQGHVTFIVLNLLLPDLDGRSFLLKLREDTVTTAIPTLIIAPLLTEEVREEARVIDADVLIENPPDTRVVSERINSRLRRARETVKVARRDPATGLLNRAAFRESFAHAVEKAIASNEPLTLALMSLDSPRTTVDQHGEAGRKAVMGRIGSIMSNSFRSTDIIARWSECDFVALFPGEDQLGGATAVEKIVRLVNKDNFQSETGGQIHVTISAGVTAVEQGSSIDDSISDAHRHLFQAASEGGNQVVSSRSPVLQRTEKVLLLVHDGLTAQVMKHLLERDGFQVHCHFTTNDAQMLEIGGIRYHLVVIDEDITPKGGFEILRELRGMASSNRTPIVMLISRNSEESMARSLELGANDYMMRPFSPFTFLRRVRRLLKKGQRDPAAEHPGEVRRVLIIDRDQKALLLAASALYERGGFVPFLAHGSEDALVRLEDLSPDAVLIDADMERTDLDRILHALRGRGEGTPPLILTTATQHDAPLERLAGEIAQGLIHKPFDALSLGSQIETDLRLFPSSIRPADAAAHLNREIQRILKQND